jgi:hypothetical protein
LRATLEQAGLEVVRLEYFDVCGVLPWLISGRLLRQRAFSAGAARLYDRWVFSYARRVEKLLPLPLGKNLLCVARRRAADAAPAAARRKAA